jgi:hypothetical protein
MILFNCPIPQSWEIDDGRSEIWFSDRCGQDESDDDLINVDAN